jgi:two-component system sensor histidine kinase/response regulator
MRNTETEIDVGRVLVVDDNEANRSLAQHTLEDEGYQVVLASGGREGLAAFERDSPDCVLLDVRMPDMDGFVVCERLRALPHGAETPILFLTALRDVDTFDRAIRVGGDDFLTKPLRPAELIVRVRSALRLRRVSGELREHYDLLKRQRDELLRLQLQKERLTAFVVHDLKTPVGSMDLHAQVLQRNAGLPAEARSSVAAIRGEARQLTRMISNLLDLSKADEGQLAPRASEQDVRALVDGVLAELGMIAKDREVELRVTLEAERIYADSDLIQRVLANLVDNAIRYSPRRAAVSVTISDVAGATELRVADAGRGIEPELREKVFNAFVQVEADSQGGMARGSRGLGLTFCKVAVEAHGGHIWVEDATPGAVFCLRLPNGI